MAAARQVSRQPYGRRHAEAELAHDLVARSKQFADADRVVPHREVVRQALFLDKLARADLLETRVGEIIEGPRLTTEGPVGPTTEG